MGENWGVSEAKTETSEAKKKNARTKVRRASRKRNFCGAIIFLTARSVFYFLFVFPRSKQVPVWMRLFSCWFVSLFLMCLSTTSRLVSIADAGALQAKT